jgi:trigger factor
VKIEKTLLEDHQVQLVVQVEQDSFDRSKSRAARSLSRKHKIPGFRPGKAPYHMVARHLGEAAIIEEAVEKIVDDLYPKLIDEQEITPYGPGRLKEIKELDPPQLEFVVPLAPSVTLGDYAIIRKEYAPPEVTDADVDKAIDNLLDGQAKTEKVERAAQVGDLVYVSIEGREKGSAEEDEPLVNLLNAPAVVEPEDADTSDEWPYPGFSNSLSGLSKGDEKEGEHTYEEDYARDENLAGKTIAFKFAVHDVNKREIPDLTDEFAKSLGEYETVDDLRADARRHLETQTKSDYDTRYDNELLDEIIGMSEIHFPPQMVDDEVDALMEQFTNRLANEGWDLETYMKANETDEASMREEFRETAVRRIRRGLIVMEVASAENIEVSERDVQGEVQRTVDLVQGSMSRRESNKLLNQSTLRGLVASAMRDALTERTFARLRAVARGETAEAAAEPEGEEAVEAVAEDIEAAPEAEEVAEIAEPPGETPTEMAEAGSEEAGEAAQAAESGDEGVAEAAEKETEPES